jgi:hypothetical protein
MFEQALGSLASCPGRQVIEANRLGLEACGFAERDRRPGDRGRERFDVGSEDASGS